jgi:antitoxin MazE
VKAKLVRIGNSRGLRLPRALIRQCGFDKAVDLAVERGALVVRPVKDTAREGWNDALADMAEHGDDRLLDPEAPV